MPWPAYPKTLLEFQQMFHDEKRCEACLDAQGLGRGVHRPRREPAAQPVATGEALRAVLLWCALGASACGGGGVSHAAWRSAPPPVVDSSLGPEDLFEARVFGEQDMSGAFRVAHDGSIDFPLIGRVQVGGLTPPQVSELIERRLLEGRFLVSPQVSILVKEYNSKRISVLGQVQRPGTFSYQDSMDIIHAITLAGGFTAIAAPNDTTVTRRQGGRESRRRVRVELIGQGRSSNFYLQPGDTIYVPESVF